MNKKNLLVAVALPLFVAACSSEDVLVESQSNNQYDGIAKVDAKFNLGETESRLATQWGIEAGKDILGFAWLGVNNGQGASVGMNGLAYQNHPLFAATAGSFQPETSIYVGKYYTYHPYDYNTKSVKAVDFTVEKQDMLSTYNDLAKTSIWISPKWTNVTLEGNVYGDDKAGVDQTFNIYPRQFSNYANLFMTYFNNDPITGAPEIKSIKVSYLDESGNVISINKFAYAPTEEEYTGTVSAADNFWSNYTMIDGTFNASTGTRATTPESVNGVTASVGAIALTPATEYIATGESYRVRYNALPAIGEVSAKTVLKVEIETTYGKITYPSNETELADNKKMTLDLIAKTQKADGTFSDFFDGEKKDGVLVGVDAHESFVQRPYKTGRFDFSVDFFDAVMDGMHVEDNAQLMKMLTFYKTYKTPAYMGGKYVERGVDLYLDADANGEFKISKKALALVQEINGNAGTGNIALHPCDLTCGENVVAPKIVVFNEADAEDENYKEVPTFGAIFGSNVDIYLDDQAWTWNSNDKKNTGRVKTIFNRGDLEINATTVNAGHTSLTIFKGIENTAAATITVKSVANVKIDLVNKGGISVKPNAELLAYNSIITNEATSLTAFGQIDNDGVIGVVENTTGEVHNYGYIHNDAAAKTYITTNETEGADFKAAWSSTNKIGTIMLTDKFDNVSVKNATKHGFIKYAWDGGATYVTPTPVEDVKYNYLIVKENLEFIDDEEEIKFLEIANTGKEIVLRSNKDNDFANQVLRGFVMQAGAKVNIKTKNKIQAEAAYITGSRVYVGGEFIYNKLTSYLGGNSTDTDCIVIYE